MRPSSHPVRSRRGASGGDPQQQRTAHHDHHHLTEPRSTAATRCGVPGPGPPRGRSARGSTPSSTAAAPGCRSCPARTPRRTGTASTPGSASSGPATTSSSTWSSAPCTPPGSSTAPTAPSWLDCVEAIDEEAARAGRRRREGGGDAVPHAPQTRRPAPTPNGSTTRRTRRILSWPFDPEHPRHPARLVAGAGVHRGGVHLAAGTMGRAGEAPRRRGHVAAGRPAAGDPAAGQAAAGRWSPISR